MPPPCHDGDTIIDTGPRLHVRVGVSGLHVPLLLYPEVSQEELETSGLAQLQSASSKAASAADECARLGCYLSHGQIRCEFYPRKKIIDQQERERVAAGKRNQTAARWKKMCPGDRMCQWRLNYTFNLKTQAYKLVAKTEDHTGHSFDNTSDSLTRIMVIGDVTEDMWVRMCKWVATPLGGYKLRTVSLPSHTHAV